LVLGLTAIIAFIRFRQLSFALKPLAYLAAFSIITEIIAYSCARYFHNNMWVYVIACPIEFGFYSMFFYRVLNNLLLKKAILFSWVLFSTITFFILIIKPNLLLGGRTDVMVMSAFCCMWCLFYYFQIFNNLNKKINISLLISITGMVIYFAFTSIFWAVYAFLNTDSYLDFLLKLEPFLFLAVILEYSAIIVSVLIYKPDFDES
jgi:hypothetical protein